MSTFNILAREGYSELVNPSYFEEEVLFPDHIYQYDKILFVWMGICMSTFNILAREGYLELVNQLTCLQRT
jgi:hypothetical protein